MNTTLWIPLRADQVQALVAHHHQEAAVATTLAARADHLRDADDLERRLADHSDRTEATA